MLVLINIFLMPYIRHTGELKELLFATKKGCTFFLTTEFPLEARRLQGAK